MIIPHHEIFLDHQAHIAITVFSDAPIPGREFSNLIVKVFSGEIPKTKIASQQVHGAIYDCFVVNLHPDWKRMYKLGDEKGD